MKGKCVYAPRTTTSHILLAARFKLGRYHLYHVTVALFHVSRRDTKKLPWHTFDSPNIRAKDSSIIQVQINSWTVLLRYSTLVSPRELSVLLLLHRKPTH